MNLAQMTKFLKRFYKEELVLEYVNNEACEGCGAYTHGKHLICLNRSIFSHYSPIEKKALLLHELGHILINSPEFPHNISLDELKAQLKGMQIALSKGMIGIYKEMDGIIRDWANIKWNRDGGKWRRYILAGKEYKKLYESKKRLCKQ